MNRRQQRVNELYLRELSQVIQREFSFKDTLVTVNAVELTQDLREGKVWIGVLGKAHPQQVITKLNAAHGYIQSLVAKRVALKFTPTMVFRFDNSVEKGVELVNYMQEIEQTIEPARDGDEPNDNDELR